MPVAEYAGRTDGGSNSATRQYAVTNGVTVRDGDFVKIVSNRIALPAVGTDELMGTVVGGDAGNLIRTYNNVVTGDVNGVAQVLVDLEKQARYFLKCSTTVLDSHVGGKYSLSTYGTNAQVLSLAAAGTQFVVLDKANGARGYDNTYAIVEMIGDAIQR